MSFTSEPVPAPELRWTELLEATSDFVAFGEPTGRALYVNAAGREMIGLTADEDVTGLEIADFVIDQEVQRLFEVALPTAAREGIWRGETVFRTRDDRPVPTSQVILAHRSAAGDVETFSTIARDISREKGAEALVALHVSVLEMIARHEPLTAALDALTLGIEDQAPGILGSVLIADEDSPCLRHGSGPSLPRAYNDAIDGIEIGPGVGSCGTAAHRRQQVVVSDVLDDPLWSDFRDLAATHGLRACWSTPICEGNGDLLGTFAMYYREPRLPDLEHQRLIEVATHLARIAIEHDRAKRRLTRSRQRFRTVVTHLPVGVFRAGPEGQNVFANEQLCEIVGRSAGELLGSGWIDHVHAQDRDRVVAGWQAAVASGAAWSSEFRVVRPSGEARIVEATATSLPARDGEGIGFLGTYNDVTERREAEAHREQFAREHAIAERLQRSLLPDHLPAFPGVELAARYLPGAEGVQVGGDWYDAFPVADGRIAVAIGDVVGRGIEAATIMGQLRTSLRVIARTTPGPSDVLARLDEIAAEAGQMATLIYAVVDPATGTLSFACAGHPPPLVRPRHGPAYYLQEARNPPLGVGEARICQAKARLGELDTLLIYTDGLIERRGVPFDDGLSALRGAAGVEGDLDSLCDGVVARLGADVVDDDVAILALRLL